MNRIILFVLLVSLSVGGMFAQSDSLNVRHHWSMLHTSDTLVMDSPTFIPFVVTTAPLTLESVPSNP